MTVFVWKPSRRELPQLDTRVRRFAIGESWTLEPTLIPERGKSKGIKRKVDGFRAIAQPKEKPSDLAEVKTKGYVRYVEAFTKDTGHLYARVVCHGPGCGEVFAVPAGKWLRRAPTSCQREVCQRAWRQEAATNQHETQTQRHAKQAAFAEAVQRGMVERGELGAAALYVPRNPAHRGTYSPRAKRRALAQSLEARANAEDARERLSIPAAE